MSCLLLLLATLALVTFVVSLNSCDGGCDEPQDLMLLQMEHSLQHASLSSSSAFVTMWIDKERTPPFVSENADIPPYWSFLHPDAYSIVPSGVCDTVYDNEHEGWKQITRLADNLAAVKATYPLVVLTNDPHLLSGSITRSHTNIIIVAVQADDFLNRTCAVSSSGVQGLMFQKLSAFALTQYERLVWLDADVVLQNNVDYLFEYDDVNGSIIYTQADIYTEGVICAGFMVFKPSYSLFQHLLTTAQQMEYCPFSDQSVIMSATSNITGDYLPSRWSTQPLSMDTVTFWLPNRTDYSGVDAVHCAYFEN